VPLLRAVLAASPATALVRDDRGATPLHVLVGAAPHAHAAVTFMAAACPEALLLQVNLTPKSLHPRPVPDERLDLHPATKL